MFKRTAVVFALFTVSTLAVARQPVFWPWQPMQVWAVPENGQAMPFPTPFWLWVVPPTQPPAHPLVPPPARVEPSAPMSLPEPSVAAIPAPAEAPPAPAPVIAAEGSAPSAPEPVASKTPAVSEPSEAPVVATAAPIKKAPVAKPKLKSVARASTSKARKLCFKDGKLDVCPQ